MTARVTLRHFTDPGCAASFAAEPLRLRLQWRYAPVWESRMSVLAPERQPEWRGGPLLRELQRRSGMPIDARERLWAAATVHACRAVVAARLRWPDRADALLRRLRVLAMAGELLDDSDTLELAAAQAGLPVAELAAYCAADEVERALRADAADAPGPSPAYVLVVDGAARVLAGLDEAERALAGRRPRAAPASAAAVLAWAGMPLATAEVAAVYDRPPDDVRAELAAGARFEPVGGDGYWSLDQPLP